MNTGTNLLGSRVDRIRIRQGILGCGAGFTVALDDKGGLRYTGENRWGQAAATAWQNMLGVFCGQDYVLGLCRDGTVVGEGRNHFHPSELESWACVSTLACGPKHAAALIGNGRVLCAGDNSMGQCETTLWRDVVDVCCGRHFTAGLHKDGTVILAGGDRAMGHLLDGWRDVAGLFTDYEGKHVYGITRTEGKLISTALLPFGVRKWRHLVCGAASARGIVGVTSRGRILCSNTADRKFFGKRTGEYVACALGMGHVAALCKSGEVISTGRNEFGQAATARWGNVYTGFESFSAARREAFTQKERTERAYQKALSEAARHARRLSCGERLTACIQADGHVNATAGLRLVKKWTDVCALSCGSAHILALHKDGRVSADGNNVGGCCHVEEWRGGKAVIAGKYHSLCLTEDGRVLFAGWNVHGQGNVEEWKHIRLLRGTDTYTVGVDVSGRIFTSGKKLPFDPALLESEAWKGLVDLAVSEHHIVGLRTDGRVVTLGDDSCLVSAAKGQRGVLDVSSWRGIRAIAAGDGFTVGLCYGGHVVAAGRNDKGQCDTSAWQHAMYVGCGRSYTVALLADGSVVTAGQHKSGHGGKETPSVTGGAVMAWEKAETTGYEPFHTAYMTDILTLCAGPEHLVAVDRHGQVMAEGLDMDGQCTSASTFLMFRDIRQLDGYGVFDNMLSTLKSHEADGAQISTKAQREQKQIAEDVILPLPRDPMPWQARTKRLAVSVGQGLFHTAYIGEAEKACVIHRHGSVSGDVESWTETQALACGTHHTVAVLKDGSLVATGRNAEGQCDVSARDGGYASVACHHHTTVAVGRDGGLAVFGKGYGEMPRSAQGRLVDSVACGLAHMVAVTQDGKAFAVGENTYGQCRVEAWENLVTVAVGDRHSVGLCADGSVVATGDNTQGQCRVDDLKDIVYVACLPEATLCVGSNGKVTVRGSAGDIQTNLTAPEGVLGLYAHEYRLSAVTTDGRLVQII